jgi:hypothetical protein
MLIEQNGGMAMRRMAASNILMTAALFGFGGKCPPAGLSSAQAAATSEVIPLQIPDKFTNLKVLPRDVDRQQLLSRMNQYAGQLGVHCSFCHDLYSRTGHADFASDVKPEKSAARSMIRMADTINAKFLAQLPKSLGTKQIVTCYTCHRELPEPNIHPAAEPLPAN